jgi:integrase/recombinase XerD
MVSSVRSEEAVMGNQEIPGPLAPYAAGFARELARCGFTALSAGEQVRVARHLSRWLAGEGMDAGALTDTVLARYLGARRAAGHRTFVSPRAMRTLAGYRRGCGSSPAGRGGAGRPGG